MPLSFRSLFILLFFSLGFVRPSSGEVSSAPKPVPKTWADEAVRMTGESEAVRERALKRLKEMPELENILRAELRGSKRPLALDVISALQLKELLPDLLKYAPEDTSGFIYLTINNLMTTKNRPELVRFYRKQLLCKFLCSASEPAKLVILETLARLKETVSIQDLRHLYVSARWPELQSAVIDYVRYAVLKHKKESYATLLKEALTSETRELREQAEAVLAQMPESRRKKWTPKEPVVNFPLRTENPADIQVRVAFGYKDARPARFVGDRYERLSLIDTLTKPCESKDILACGFERDKNNLNLLSKLLKNAKGERVLLKIKITASAAGPDDDDNRANPYQKHLSALSQNNFLEGLRSAEAVFYVGHSRDGGGPDFNPPKITSHQHVAYAWYRQNEPGLKDLLENLKGDEKIKRSPLRLGLLSCASTQHFEKRIQQVAAHVKPVTVPKLLYYSEALEMLSKELSEYIHQKINGYGPKS